MGVLWGIEFARAWHAKRRPERYARVPVTGSRHGANGSAGMMAMLSRSRKLVDFSSRDERITAIEGCISTATPMMPTRSAGAPGPKIS